MDFVKLGKVNLPTPVYRSFKRLQNAILNNTSQAITVVDGFKTEEEVVDELRARLIVKNKAQAGRANEVRVLVNNPENFDPPLQENVKALRDPTGQELVYSIPNLTSVDPRRSGRIIQIGPKTNINPTVLFFLVQNAGNYGFLHYGPKDPSIWYWRGDKDSGKYTPQQVVYSFSGELSYLL